MFSSLPNNSRQLWAFVNDADEDDGSYQQSILPPGERKKAPPFRSKPPPPPVVETDEGSEQFGGRAAVASSSNDTFPNTVRAGRRASALELIVDAARQDQSSFEIKNHLVPPPQTTATTRLFSPLAFPEAVGNANNNIIYPPQEPSTVSGNAQATPRFNVNGNVYTAIRTLGEGGFGIVYEVVRESDHQVFALKRIKVQSNYNDHDRLAKAFYEEVEVLKQLQGVPQVIQLIDYSNCDTRPQSASHTGQCELLLVMEFAEVDIMHYIKSKWRRDSKIIGETYREEYCESGMQCTPPVAQEGLLGADPLAIRFLWQSMVRCTYALHEHNFIHRDIKPENFAIVKGQVTLLDFGLAFKIQSIKELAKLTNTAGSPFFMAPECMQGIFSIYSDVWALGMTLLDMAYPSQQIQKSQTSFNNRIYFDESAFDILDPKTQKDITDHDLLDVVRQCLMFKPEERPTTEKLLVQPFLLVNQRREADYSACPVGSAVATTCETGNGAAAKTSEACETYRRLVNFILANKPTWGNICFTMLIPGTKMIVFVNQKFIFYSVWCLSNRRINEYDVMQIPGSTTTSYQEAELKAREYAREKSIPRPPSSAVTASRSTISTSAAGSGRVNDGKIDSLDADRASGRSKLRRFL